MARAAAAYDDPMDAAVADILQFDPTRSDGAAALSQSRLPLRIGGLGIPSAARTSGPAFTASLAACWHPATMHNPALRAVDLSRTHDLPASLAEAALILTGLTRDHAARAQFNAQPEASPDLHERRLFRLPGYPPSLPTLASFAKQPTLKAQHLFTCVADHEAWWSLHSDLIANGLARDPVRLLSFSQPGSTAFHRTVPARHNQIIHTEFMLAATQRQLGVPLSCLRGLDTDPYGDAAVNTNVDFTMRHNEVLPAWIGALRHAYRSRGSTSCKIADDCIPDGVIHHYDGGRNLYLEAKVASPLTSVGAPRDPRAATVALAGISHLPPDIDAKYSDRLGRNGAGPPYHRLAYLIHDTFGALHPLSVKVLDDARTHMRGRDRQHADLSHPDARANDDLHWSAPSHAARAFQDISRALHISIAKHILRFAEEARAAPLPTVGRTAADDSLPAAEHPADAPMPDAAAPLTTAASSDDDDDDDGDDDDNPHPKRRKPPPDPALTVAIGTGGADDPPPSTEPRLQHAVSRADSTLHGHRRRLALAWADADSPILACSHSLHPSFHAAPDSLICSGPPDLMGYALAHSSSGSVAWFSGSPSPLRGFSVPSALAARSTGTTHTPTRHRQPLVHCRGCDHFVPAPLIAATYYCTAPVSPTDHLAAGGPHRQPVEDGCPFVFPPVLHSFCRPCSLWDTGDFDPSRRPPQRHLPPACPTCTASPCPCCDFPHRPPCPYYAGDPDDPDTPSVWSGVSPSTYLGSLARHPFAFLDEPAPTALHRPAPPPHRTTPAPRPELGQPTAAPRTPAAPPHPTTPTPCPELGQPKAPPADAPAPAAPHVPAPPPHPTTPAPRPELGQPKAPLSTQHSHRRPLPPWPTFPSHKRARFAPCRHQPRLATRPCAPQTTPPRPRLRALPSETEAARQRADLASTAAALRGFSARADVHPGGPDGAMTELLGRPLVDRLTLAGLFSAAPSYRELLHLTVDDVSRATGGLTAHDALLLHHIGLGSDADRDAAASTASDTDSDGGPSPRLPSPDRMAHPAAPSPGCAGSP